VRHSSFVLPVELTPLPTLSRPPPVRRWPCEALSPRRSFRPATSLWQVARSRGDEVAHLLLVGPVGLGDSSGVDGDLEDWLAARAALAQLVHAWRQTPEDGGEARSGTDVSPPHGGVLARPWRSLRPDLDLPPVHALHQIDDERAPRRPDVEDDRRFAARARQLLRVHLRCRWGHGSGRPGRHFEALVWHPQVGEVGQVVLGTHGS
jgi:hypothetical protein